MVHACVCVCVCVCTRVLEVVTICVHVCVFIIIKMNIHTSKDTVHPLHILQLGPQGREEGFSCRRGEEEDIGRGEVGVFALSLCV